MIAGIKLKKWEQKFVEHSSALDRAIPSQEHIRALHYAVTLGTKNKHVSPHILDTMLTGSGFREVEQKGAADPSVVSEYLWLWCRAARKYIPSTIKVSAKTAMAFSLHHEFMRIAPFKNFNGSIGRILLVNHMLLLNLSPCTILESDRKRYERWLKIQLGEKEVNKPAVL